MYQGLRPASTSEDWANTTVISVLSLAFFIAGGAFVGARRDLLASLRERVATAEREQPERVAQARATERARIAREMHDVLAHRISLVAMQSGALAYRSDLTREETAQAAAVMRDNAHQALGELREVLGLLRDPDEPDAQPRRPQPTLADLDDLVAQTRASGVDVHATLAIDDPGRVPRPSRATATGSSRKPSPTPASMRSALRWSSRSERVKATVCASSRATASRRAHRQTDARIGNGTHGADRAGPAHRRRPHLRDRPTGTSCSRPGCHGRPERRRVGRPASPWSWSTTTRWSAPGCG